MRHSNHTDSSIGQNALAFSTNSHKTIFRESNHSNLHKFAAFFKIKSLNIVDKISKHQADSIRFFTRNLTRNFLSEIESSQCKFNATKSETSESFIKARASKFQRRLMLHQLFQWNFLLNEIIRGSRRLHCDQWGGNN